MNGTPTRTFSLSDFDYDLPEELIAQTPAASRTASRLLVVPSEASAASANTSASMPTDALNTLTDPHFRDLHFTDLPSLLRPNDLLVFNNSKVVPARLHATKPTGGQVELLIERVTRSHTATAMLRASKKPPAGTALNLLRPSAREVEGAETSQTATPRAAKTAGIVTLEGRDPMQDDRFLLRFHEPVFEVLDEWGELPLPPYIAHSPDAVDAQRYQTVYAQTPGSVAAPTAGLHFDEALLARLKEAGVRQAQVTLHVGSGTFAPVREEDLSKHQMHSEWCSMSDETAQAIQTTKAAGGRIIAVGTTSARTLESAALRPEGLAGEWETKLFITPGFQFQLVDGLITNFHLPKSTLLMLVSALAGYDRIREAYQHAIAERYRFFSYGDAMFLSPSVAPSVTPSVAPSVAPSMPRSLPALNSARQS